MVLVTSKNKRKLFKNNKKPATAGSRLPGGILETETRREWCGGVKKKKTMVVKGVYLENSVVIIAMNSIKRYQST